MNVVQGRRRRDERGVEAVAMIFVIPFMVVLILGLIDVGMMFRARMLVENLTRDTARGIAADGGNLSSRTNSLNGKSWTDLANERLYAHGHCLLSACESGAPRPEMVCVNYHPNGTSYPGNEVDEAGDTVTCTVHYPYRPINGELLNSPLGLGIGTMLKPFDISASARAETGLHTPFG